MKELSIGAPYLIFRYDANTKTEKNVKALGVSEMHSIVIDDTTFILMPNYQKEGHYAYNYLNQTIDYNRWQSMDNILGDSTGIIIDSLVHKLQTAKEISYDSEIVNLEELFIRILETDPAELLIFCCGKSNLLMYCGNVFTTLFSILAKLKIKMSDCKNSIMCFDGAISCDILMAIYKLSKSICTEHPLYCDSDTYKAAMMFLLKYETYYINDLIGTTELSEVELENGTLTVKLTGLSTIDLEIYNTLKLVEWLNRILLLENKPMIQLKLLLSEEDKIRLNRYDCSSSYSDKNIGWDRFEHENVIISHSRYTADFVQNAALYSLFVNSVTKEQAVSYIKQSLQNIDEASLAATPEIYFDYITAILHYFDKETVIPFIIENIKKNRLANTDTEAALKFIGYCTGKIELPESIYDYINISKEVNKDNFDEVNSLISFNISHKVNMAELANKYIEINGLSCDTDIVKTMLVLEREFARIGVIKDVVKSLFTSTEKNKVRKNSAIEDLVSEYHSQPHHSSFTQFLNNISMTSMKELLICAYDIVVHTAATDEKILAKEDLFNGTYKAIDLIMKMYDSSSPTFKNRIKNVFCVATEGYRCRWEREYKIAIMKSMLKAISASTMPEGDQNMLFVASQYHTPLDIEATDMMTVLSEVPETTEDIKASFLKAVLS